MSSPCAELRSRRSALAELGRAFFKVGALGFGGPAIIGLMQLEAVERRRWLDKPRFVEGLALVNLLPGPVAAQLAIFIGYARAGIAGGIIAGLAFIIPGFLVITAFAAAYNAYSAAPALRHALAGVAPVVIGIFAAAVYRLGKAAIQDRAQLLIAIASALAIATNAIAVALLFLLAGCVGVAQSGRWKRAVLALAVLCALYAALRQLPAPSSFASGTPSFVALAAFFAEVGALTFGGGLSILAFVQQAVVRDMGWLSAPEFVDALALGQLTPGPVVLVASFVGYKLLGLPGALVATVAVFLPSFIALLAVLPLLQRYASIHWLKAAMCAIGPATIGALAASLAQLALPALPDVMSAVLFVGACALVLARNVGPVPLIALGAFVGTLLSAIT